MFTTRTARKDHTCCGCSRPIRKGSTYLDERDANRKGEAFRWHSSCGHEEIEARRADREDDEALAAVEDGWDGHKIWMGG